MNTLQRLYADQGQSPWIDFIDRELIESGRLGTLIGDGIRGLTSNPTIFAKAVGSGHYDSLIREKLDAGESNQAIYEAIAVGDVGDAADLLRPVYDGADGADGFASIEVEPELGDDTQGTIARARYLWSSLGRPNVFVKIPATQAGIPAIEACIADGINVNVTLMFSVEVYRQVAMAYLSGLRRRLASGQDVSRVASVASFFVSRVDTKVDKLLEALGTDQALNARGTAAVANARQAYDAYLEIFHGPEFADLREAGAHVQRCLWASTSTKNPSYPDIMYVAELIGPETVNTMPIETIEAFLDHGDVRRTLDADLHAAHDAIRAIEAEGVSMAQVTAELLSEGMIAFAKSFDDLIASIESKRAALAPA
ncbi:MAG TPA: transaldolase [Candidatus Limnocylindria bacterium]|nr:transaldolase [Candidatus Limnocylindria bacterium]